MKSAEHVPGVGLQYVESMRRYAQDDRTQSAQPTGIALGAREPVSREHGFREAFVDVPKPEPKKTGKASPEPDSA